MQTLKCFLHPAISAGLLGLVLTGCGHKAAPQTSVSEQVPQPLRSATPDPLALALTPHEGDGPVDKEIRRFQEQVRDGQNRSAALERLGWAFVAKARGSFDSGYYKLAEACASALDSNSPGCAEALLLRGHVLQNLHRFKEAETLARELSAKRGLSFDYALLGDALMEQGKLKEAVAAYQVMVDLRPDLQSYSRIAHIRWLTGDLHGAVEMMRAAVSASSPDDADSNAWVNSRLAALELQSGEPKAAMYNCRAALEARPNYPPALLLRGKMLLAEDDAEAAIVDLERAVKQNPLPEYQWALAETLRAAGREKEAQQLESRLRNQGATSDPRTLSLYLATRGEDTDFAVRLAEQELQQRTDVFTHDALAWALAAAGRLGEARGHIATALAEGTADARLFFHATVIASRVGRIEEARNWFARAAGLMTQLLPSEQARLLDAADNITGSDTKSETPLSRSAATDTSASAFVAERK